MMIIMIIKVIVMKIMVMKTTIIVMDAYNINDVNENNRVIYKYNLNQIPEIINY